MIIEAFIIDDEERSINNLKHLIQNYCQNINVIGSHQSPLEAISQIKKVKPKVLFLDIQMPNINGLEFLELINDLELTVIVVSAYDQYAIKAIKLNVFDYLLKPVSIKELIEIEKKLLRLYSNPSVEKIQPDSQHLKDTKRIQNNNFLDQKIILPLQEGAFIESVSNILYFQSNNNYTSVYRITGKRLMMSKHLKYFEDCLDRSVFVRVHNSYLVNIHHVKKYCKQGGNYLVMNNDEKLLISRRKVTDFEQKLNSIFKKL